MNRTTKTITNESEKYTIEDYYIPAVLSSICALSSILISILILMIVCRTKSRLHTVNHLLICNTCIASILYCIVTINNSLYLIFVRWEISNISCRWRGYFIYAGIAGLLYSYFLQALSRYFFSILSPKYRWLRRFKTHFILISVKWFFVLIIVSPNLITNDINYSPISLCWVPSECLLHTAYTYFAYYVIPVILIIIIYFSIFYRIKKVKNNSLIIQNSPLGEKRDLHILKNIVILLSIYLGAGIPTIIADSTSSKIPYLISLVTQVFAVFIGNVCTILLDREIRQVIKSIISNKTVIMPVNNAQLPQNIQNNF